MRLSILGGSSPFLGELFLEWRRNPTACPETIVLHGRNASTLLAVRAFAETMLPGRQVLATTSLAEALDGAELIFHQVRYGGLEGRSSDEAYCRHRRMPADETIGPGGFRAALRMRAELLDMAGAIATRAPLALVINFTNPLSLSTSLLRHAGVSRVCGLCELPEATATLLEETVGEPLGWEYVGLNHRGFLFNITRRRGADTADVLDHLPGKEVGGIPLEVVRQLKALPTKYFRLFIGAPPISRYGRAGELAETRGRIVAQLKTDPHRIPNALAERRQDWWRQAVTPFLNAIRGFERLPLVLNIPDKDGITREARYLVGEAGFVKSPATCHPETLDPWLTAYDTHEKASLAALLSPTHHNLKAVFKADPIIRLYGSGRL